MEGKTFQVPAVLDGVSTLKDGGLSVRFHTQEVNNEQKIAVMNFMAQFGWLLFSSQEHDDELELDKIRKDTGGKTPSQRLRGVLYIEYQQSGKQDLTFEQYYAKRMEQFIGYVKQNLSD